MSDALRELMERKDAVERQIVEISEALAAENMGGVSGPLVDAQGFPRADVDVHQTRNLRHQLACLNTDHRRLMTQIEQGMVEHFAAASTSSSGLVSPPPSASSVSIPIRHTPQQSAPVPAAEAYSQASSALSNALANGVDSLVPFAEIDEVAVGGPAAAAGIQCGDKLLSFGGLTAGNHDQLRALARLTQRSVGGKIPLLVLRTEAAREDRVSLELHPRQWHGQGLLGCHLRP
ncbi:MAG: hypothetical protein SGPRY_009526, partial [Prymnesium sp.]